MIGPQRTILFLIADTGAGHRSAANAIRNALTFLVQKRQEERLIQEHAGEEEPESISAQTGCRIEIVDVFEEYSRFPLREAVKLYGPAIRYRPKLYGRIYQFSNQAQRFSAMKSISTPLVHNGLLRLIKSVKPDVIVSVHPLLNHVTIRILQDLGLHIPFITVVTDLVTAHHAWFAPGADAYIVPTTSARELALKQGMDPHRVHLLGMPIDPKFMLSFESKQELQRKLGLKPDLPVVLLVGGGEGAMGLRAAVHAISQARLQVQLLIIAGRNKRLYVELQRLRSSLHVPARVFGFVQNMQEMMHASDVIVTKAGPGTICEALACNLPIILSSYVPGQEEGNVTFVEENQVGMLAYDSVELINILRRLLMPGSELLHQELENAKRISRPGASFDIASCILDFLPAAGIPSVWKNVEGKGASRINSRQRRSSIPSRTIQPGMPASRSRVAMRTLRRRLRRLAFLQRPVHDLSQLRSQPLIVQEHGPNFDSPKVN
ncbi:MAG: MGDG synthase family glycosyltransferase [Ktedonobacteraceae bacterium]